MNGLPRWACQWGRRAGTGYRRWRGLRSLPDLPGSELAPGSAKAVASESSPGRVGRSVFSPAEPQPPAIASQFSGCPRGWVKPARPVALTRGHHLTRPGGGSVRMQLSAVPAPAGSVLERRWKHLRLLWRRSRPGDRPRGSLGSEDPRPEGSAEGGGRRALGVHRARAHPPPLPLQWLCCSKEAEELIFSRGSTSVLRRSLGSGASSQPCSTCAPRAATTPRAPTSWSCRRPGFLPKPVRVPAGRGPGRQPLQPRQPHALPRRPAAPRLHPIPGLAREALASSTSASSSAPSSSSCGPS